MGNSSSPSASTIGSLAVGARRDGERRLGVVRRELGHRHVAAAERRREVAHGAGQVRDAAERRRDLGRRRCRPRSGGSWRTSGSARRRRRRARRRGGGRRGPPTVDLDRRAGAAQSITAGPSPGSRSTTATARTAPERCRNSRRATTTASSAPTRGDQLDGVLVHLLGQLAGRERDRAQLAARARPCAFTAVPMRSTVIIRCRSSAPAQRMPSSSTSRSSGCRPARSAGAAVDHLDDLDGAAAPEAPGDPRRQRSRADRRRRASAAHAPVGHERAAMMRRVASLMGTARPRPTPATAVLIPTTQPRPSTSAPPELPGFSAASVCTTFSTIRRGPPRRPTGSERPSAETTPAVTEPAKPCGLPMATTSWPTRSLAASPSCAGRGRSASARSTARSDSGSAPDDLEAHLAPVDERGAAAARSLDDVRGGDEEAVGGDDDGAAAAHRRAPAAQAAVTRRLATLGARSRGTRGDHARVGVERLVVGRALFATVSGRPAPSAPARKFNVLPHRDDASNRPAPASL